MPPAPDGYLGLTMEHRIPLLFWLTASLLAAAFVSACVLVGLLVYTFPGSWAMGNGPAPVSLAAPGVWKAPPRCIGCSEASADDEETDDPGAEEEPHNYPVMHMMVVTPGWQEAARRYVIRQCNGVYEVCAALCDRYATERMREEHFAFQRGTTGERPRGWLEIRDSCIAEEQANFDWAGLPR